MAEQATLTLAFLSHAPQSAAQVLEEIDPAAAAAFLEDIPARIAAPAVGHMGSWNAARCIERLPPPHAAAILTQLLFHESAGLMRLVTAERRSTILDSLSGRLDRRLRNALSYPAGSVGAWIDPEIPAFAVSATVGDALRYLANATVADHVFLHDAEDGRFAGAIAVPALMRAVSGRALSELPAQRLQPLSSRATLASVAFREEWDEFLMLPVIGRSRTVVGGLSRASLRKGMHEYRSARDVVPGTMTGHILSAFATACAGLVHLAADTERPFLPEKKDA